MSEAAPRPALQSLPEGIVNLADFEAHAQAHMTPSAWAYLNGGAADEQVLRKARAEGGGESGEHRRVQSVLPK